MLGEVVVEGDGAENCVLNSRRAKVLLDSPLAVKVRDPRLDRKSVV